MKVSGFFCVWGECSQCACSQHPIVLPMDVASADPPEIVGKGNVIE